jgi:DNA-binding NarL/FixJ family response regulator
MFFTINNQMKRHILLVDNNSTERTKFKAALKNANAAYTLSYASCAIEALTLMTEDQPDFVFIENNLPVTPALYLLSFIKTSRKFRRAKVFIYTQMISDELGKMARLLGAAGCMQKNGAFNWLTHQLKALIASDLVPGYIVLKYYTPLYDEVVNIMREAVSPVKDNSNEAIVLDPGRKLLPVRQAG